ncbi:hypothetical protein CD790_11120 [Streptomyces sp. SAJ15]|nr:hypothetical protein CD790_11120 [Streptomyces sp. SAJ15]
MSAAALLGAGMLAAGTPASAAPTGQTDVWYTFQNVASDLNLDAFGNGNVLSWTADSSGTQDFYLRDGSLPGYQLESKYYPGRCATAKGADKQITLEMCNSNVQAQYFDYDLKDSGSTFASRKFRNNCITDEGDRNSAILRHCTWADNQVYLALAY